MPKNAAILDFSNPRIKRMVIDHIKQVKGLHWFELRKARDQRTLRQNAYLWGVVYKAVQAGIEEAWGERKSVEWIHQYMKKRFLTEPVINRNTGEVIDQTVGSSAGLDTQEFADYVDQIIKFAGEYLGVNVPPAEPVREHQCQT